MPILEQHGHLHITPDVRVRLLALSPATADRLLQRARKAGEPRGISTTKAGTLLKHQIPVRCRACAVEATELARRAAKPLPPRVIAFVTELNTNPGAVTDEDLNRLQIRGTDTYSRIRLPELLPLSEPAIAAEIQAVFPDAPASQAVVLRWHLRGLMLLLALRKAALSAQIEAQKPGRNGSA